MRPALSAFFGLAIVLIATGFLATPLAAQEDFGGLLRELSSTISGEEPGSEGTTSLAGRLIQLFALITVLSIAPGLLVVMTSFTFCHRVFDAAVGSGSEPDTAKHGPERDGAVHDLFRDAARF